MQQEYDWYKTKPIGEIAKIKERYGCVWCPQCGGSGREKFGTIFSKEKICTRCHGRMIVAARKITGKEMWRLSGYEREKVMAVRQYPYFRQPLSIAKEVTPDDVITLEKWLDQEALEAHLGSLACIQGSGAWAFARGHKRAYEKVLNEIRRIGRDQRLYTLEKKVK